MTICKLPRADTRVRALFDELCRHPDGCVWRDLKDAYDDKAPAYDRRMFGPRYYSNMTISKYIRKFATHTGPAGKRVYKLRPEYARMLLTNPFYFIANKDVNRAKIEAIADLPDIRVLAEEIRQGFDYLDAHRNEEKGVLPPEFVWNPDGIKAGDWVKVLDLALPPAAPLKANGIGDGTYQVESVTDGFVHLSGFAGGWEPRRFAVVPRPPQNPEGIMPGDWVALKNPLHGLSSYQVEKVDGEKIKISGVDEMRDISEFKMVMQLPQNRLRPVETQGEQLAVGDWVRVREPDSYESYPLRAHGIYKSAHRIDKIENGYLRFADAGGGWRPERFERVPTPPSIHDKGAPEIRDMAWSSNYTEPTHNPFEHAYLEQVTKHNKQLQDLLKEAEDRRKVLNHEIEVLKNDLEVMTARATFLKEQAAKWDGDLGRARDMLHDTQHAEVGQVYSMCGDLDALLQEIQDKMRDE